IFLAVSINDSPFDRLEPLGVKSWVSADKRLAARLKLVRVRVEFSKNRLKTIRPWSAGTFLRLRVEISANDSAVSRMATISSLDNSSKPRRCFRLHGATLSAGPATGALVTAGHSSAIVFRCGRPPPLQ